MQNYSTAPSEMVASFWRNRSLILSLVKREVVGRYKGSALGILWSFATPVFMLTVYTFVFSTIFKARWGTGGDSKSEFALLLFSGLLIFNIFSECITKAPNLILANTNYVKKVIFPLEILPWVAMGSALFHFAASFGVWLIAYTILIGPPHWTLVLSPLVIAPFILFVMGLSWIMASLGVYLRDVGQIIGIAVQALMFLTPIFYPTSALPNAFQPIMSANPITPSIEMMRNLMHWGQMPDPATWLTAASSSIIIAILGFAWFQKTRKGFSDVL